MTKRWLSLVLVLTLLSTLFTGVAYAKVEYPASFSGATTHTLTAGVVNTVTLGKIVCQESKVASALVDQWGTDGVQVAFKNGSGNNDWDDVPSTVTLDPNDNTKVIWEAEYTPKMLPSSGSYEIKIQGGGSYFTVPTGYQGNTIKVTVDGSSLGSYTIANHYRIDVYEMINVGKTAQAKLTYEGRPIEVADWSSDNPNVAKVDGTGKITGVSLGNATITAETESGVTEETEIWVADQVMTPEIEFKPQDDGATTVTITCPTEGATIYYTMAREYWPSDPAEKDENTKRYGGPFDIKDAGFYYIKAIAYKEGMTKSDIGWGWVYVGEGAPDTKVVVSPMDATINGRGSAQFKAEVLPETANQKVDWWYLKLDDEDRYYNTDPYAYATVDDDGTVTSTGYMDEDKKEYVDLKVIAEAWDGTTGEAELRIVKVNPTGVNYETNEITIPLGENKTFTASVAPAHASNDDLKLEITGSEVLGLTISDPVVDPATGLHTWTLKMDKATGKVGDYKLRVVAVENNVGKEITLHVVNPSVKAPTPVFTPSATTFTELDQKVTITSPAGTKLVVLVNGVEQKLTGDNTYTYRVDYDKDSNPLGIKDTESVTITAYSEALGGAYTIDSDPVANVYKKDLPVEDITFDERDIYISGKGTAKVTVSAQPTGVASSKVKVSSSDTNVFTVAYNTAEKNYVLTGVNPGTARLIATDGKITKFADVTVDWLGVNYIEVKHGNKELERDETVTVKQTQYTTLSATGYGWNNIKASDQTFTWTSYDPTVATVDSKGKVVALKPGTTTITVTEPKSKVDMRVVIQVPSEDVKTVATPVFDPAEKTDPWTEAQTIKVSCATEGATLYYTLNGNYPTTSSAQVPTEGIKLEGPDKVTVRVLAVKDGLNEATAEATYEFKIPLKSAALPATQAMRAGETLQMVLTLNPTGASLQSTSWKVTDLNGKATSLAAIDSKGVLTAKDEGMVLVSAIVTDKYETRKTVTSVVTITKQPVVTLTMIPDVVTLNIGESQQLSYAATRETAKATRGTWASSNTKVATVDNNGFVRAVGAGVAYVTVTVDGKVGTATINVLDDPATIPAKLTKSPTYTATPANKTYNALANGSLSVQVGTLAPAAGETLEQLFYYYNVKVSPSAKLTTVDSSANFMVAKDGKVYLNVSDVGTEDFFFDYVVTLEEKDGRDADWLGVINSEVKNNIVHIVTTPTNINFTAAALNDTVLSGGGTATLYFGTVTNYADFQATSVAVSAAASVSGTTGGLTAAAAIDSTGKVSVSMEGLKKGEYTVTVTLSAAGCTSVTTSAAKVTVISDKEDPEPPTPTTKALVVTAASGAYTGVKGVTQLLKNDGTATFTVTGLSNGVTVTGWKSSKPSYVAIASSDSTSAKASLKKAGSAVITATLSDGSKLTMKVNVNKGTFAKAENITLQTKPGNKWVDVTAEGITVVPKKSGQKSVPSRLESSDGGKIVIQKVEFSNGAIASRSGDNPSPIKVKKADISDGATTTLTITANGAQYSVVIKVNSGAKDVYLEDVIAEIEEIIELEAE